MKKLFALIFALMMLCACGAEEEAELNIIDEVSYLGENGKFGFHKEGVPVTEAVFDEIFPEEKIEHRFIYFPVMGNDEIGNIYAGAITEGTRKSVDRGENGGTVLIEEPNTNYTLYESGTDFVINETPLSNFNFVAPGNRNNTGSYLVQGAFEGDCYVYKKEPDGKWDLYAKESGDISFWMEDRPQFARYFWSWSFEGHGFADSEGNIIVEPIYSRTEIINDRIFAYNGHGSDINVDIARTYIMDFDGKIICDSYINVCLGAFEYGKFVLYAFGTDENGNLGFWFIDEDGNKLSQKFESIYFVYEGVTDENGDYAGEYAIKAEITENGETKIISTAEYARDYE